MGGGVCGLREPCRMGFQGQAGQVGSPAPEPRPLPPTQDGHKAEGLM